MKTGKFRILTVREPWASAIVDGHKPTENRAQGFPKNFRGILIIHAAKTLSARGARDPRILEHYTPEDIAAMPLGHVIGEVELVDVHPSAGCCQPWGEDTYPPANLEDRSPGIVTHLALEHPHRYLRPVPARGALGLWIPDEDLTLELNRSRSEAPC